MFRRFRYPFGRVAERKPFEEEVVVGMADRSAVGMLAGAAVGSSLAAPLT